jgi:hypothetical protein
MARHLGQRAIAYAYGDNPDTHHCKTHQTSSQGEDVSTLAALQCRTFDDPSAAF